MFLLADFINPQGTFAFTTRLDKIKTNLDLIEPLKANIDKQRKSSKKAFSTLTVVGRWLIIYQANVTDDDETMMYFVDFKLDLSDYRRKEIFSKTTIQNLITLQERYDKVFTDKMDTIELSFAEPFEKIVRKNLFACDNDDIVLNKAKTLGALPMIENLKDGDKVKVVLVDERQKVDNDYITNIYALIHFGGHGEERKHDNGFAYIKLYDLLKNFDQVQDFQLAIEKAGGKFDRAFFMERFDKFKLN